MEIMYKLLSNHDIVQNDFIEQTCEIAQGRVITLPCQPGHSIMHHLLNDSALLRKVSTCTCSTMCYVHVYRYMYMYMYMYIDTCTCTCTLYL